MDKNPELTRHLGADPLTVETLPDGFVVDPTPTEALYVRNNLAVPTRSEGWSVELAGVDDAGHLEVAELFGDLPRVEETTVLQCAGNGRRRLAEPAPGVQWDMGGMACVRWSGVRLADVVKARGGVVDGMPYLTVLGGDADETDPARVERSVPTEAALDEGLVVDQMNGEPLPWLHGGPVRFVMPGYFAVNSVKWVRRIAFTEKESDADIQTVRYRMVPKGEVVSPFHPSLWSMGPTSHVVAVSRVDGRVVVEGVAFSGGDPVVGVDLSCDGIAWEPGELGADLGRFGWRRFVGTVQVNGSGWVAARCRTDVGVQPERSTPNQDGYAVDGWRDLAHRLVP